MAQTANFAQTLRHIYYDGVATEPTLQNVAQMMSELQPYQVYARAIVEGLISASDVILKLYDFCPAVLGVRSLVSKYQHTCEQGCSC